MAQICHLPCFRMTVRNPGEPLGLVHGNSSADVHALVMQRTLHSLTTSDKPRCHSAYSIPSGSSTATWCLRKIKWSRRRVAAVKRGRREKQRTCSST
ncbi:hypothetical protein COCCADRAFT_94785 [Bipolaris zeicola 26-R-13]|uniref:Uncharacterized protein n=1 Tax=Cochliobolus carbonum (strain 26-R-13) TaxID=930089 RepID=W6YR05_COCC2|nr:uncharacterized protein COCCADRAFT_94785 [Bipolaris zeicola 26-R-13]EUC33911.1 hypothetical protein COCCADRAFT_94785 [Bipolaris zeicola 26-R-13]